jgi:hypothetical protein
MMYGDNKTLAECSKLCADDDECKVFLYGKGDREKQCFKELTASEACDEGVVSDNSFDLYVDQGPDCDNALVEQGGVEGQTQHQLTIPGVDKMGGGPGNVCVKETANFVTRLGYDNGFDSAVSLPDQVFKFSSIFSIVGNYNPHMRTEDVVLQPATIYATTPLYACFSDINDVVDVDSVHPGDLSFTGYRFSLGTSSKALSGWTVLGSLPGGNHRGLGRPLNNNVWAFKPLENFVRCSVKCYDKCEEGEFVAGPATQVQPFGLDVTSGPASGKTAVQVTGAGFLQNHEYTCRWKSVIDGSEETSTGKATSFEHVSCVSPRFFFSAGSALVTVDGPVIRSAGCFVANSLNNKFLSVHTMPGQNGLYACLKLCRTTSLETKHIAVQGNKCRCESSAEALVGETPMSLDKCNAPCVVIPADAGREATADRAQVQMCGSSSGASIYYNVYSSEMLTRMKSVPFEVEPTPSQNISGLTLTPISGGIKINWEHPIFLGGNTDTSRFNFELKYQVVGGKPVDDGVGMKYDYGGDSKVISITAPGDNREVELKYLQPQLNYEVFIRAWNTHGWSPWSLSRAESQLKPPVEVEPSDVRNVRVTAIGPYSLALTFDRPVYDGNAFLSYYKVYHQAETDSGCLTQLQVYEFNVTSKSLGRIDRLGISYTKDPEDSETVLLSNLTAETVQYLQVSAMNAGRRSSIKSPYSPLQVRTPAETSPRNVTGNIYNNTNITIGDDITCNPCKTFTGAFNFTMNHQKLPGQQLNLLPEAHYLSMGTLTFTVENVKIVGLGKKPTDTTIDCLRHQCFRSGSNQRDGTPVFASLIENVLIKHGRANEMGGAALIQNVHHPVTFKDVEMHLNYAKIGGGALAIVECTSNINIIGGFLFHNGINYNGLDVQADKAAGDYTKFGGGTIVINSAFVNFDGVRMRGQHARFGGQVAAIPWGKLGNSDGGSGNSNVRTTINLKNSRIEHGVAKVSGAGFYLWGIVFNGESTNFDSNVAEKKGGCLAVYSSEAQVENCHFVSCTAVGGEGGALDAYASTVVVKDTSMEWSIAREGGAINALQSPVYLSRLNLSNNSAGGMGGTLNFGLNSEIRMDNSNIFDSRSSGADGNDGGGGCAYLDQVTYADIKTSHFKNCYALGPGGAIAVHRSVDVSIDGHFESSVTDSKTGGGAIFLDFSDLSYRRPPYPKRPKIYARFTNNVAKYGGGGAILWTAIPYTMGNMPNGYPILLQGYSDSSKRLASGNSAMYGDFIASSVSKLFLESGPSSAPGATLDMQGTDSCSQHSDRCPSICAHNASHQCTSWVRRVHKATDIVVEEESGKVFLHPYKVLLLDFYNQQVTSEIGRGVMVDLKSTTNLDRGNCSLIKNALHDGIFCQLHFKQESGSQASDAGKADFTHLIIQAKPSEHLVEKALTFTMTAPEVTTASVFPNPSVNFRNCVPGEYYDYEESACADCPIGKYTNQKNYNIDAVGDDCISCSSGRYVSIEKSVECAVCANGRYQEKLGSFFCESCPTGKWTNGTVGHSQACFDCPTGRFGYKTELGAGSCERCEPGKYTDILGLSSCKKCTSGFYASKVGHKACEVCPAGKRSGLGSTECPFGCAAGKYKTATQKQCTVCPAGQSTNTEGGRSFCDLCVPGMYSAVGSAVCTKCPVGMQAPRLGQANRCSPCPKGKYAHEKGTPNCTLCEKGTYNVEYDFAVGGPMPKECRTCTAGRYTNGLDGWDHCIPCPAGEKGIILTDATRTVNKNYGSCRLCGFDTANPQLGKVQCDKCNISTWTAKRKGQTSCTPCIEGEIYPVSGSNTECKICPGPDQGNVADKGTYSFIAGDTTRDVCNNCPGGAVCDGGNMLKTNWGWWRSVGLDKKRKKIAGLTGESGSFECPWIAEDEPFGRQCGDPCNEGEPDCVCEEEEGKLQKTCTLKCVQNVYRQGVFFDKCGVMKKITRCPGFEKYVSCEDVLARASTSNNSRHDFDWQGSSIILNDDAYAALPESCQACRQTEFIAITEEVELTEKLEIAFKIKGNSKVIKEILSFQDSRAKYVRTLQNGTTTPCNFMAGYHGRLCQACLPGFARNGRYSCMPCPPLEYSYAMGVVGFIVGFAGIVVFIRIVMQDAGSTSTAGSMKRILINYMQVVAICSYFDLNWSPAAMELFKVQGWISSVSDQLLNIDCVLNMYEDLAVRPYYAKLLGYAGLPMTCLLISQFYWYWVYCKNCICGHPELRKQKSAKVAEQRLQAEELEKTKSKLLKDRFKHAKNMVLKKKGLGGPAVALSLTSAANNKRMQQISKEARYLKKELKRAGVDDPAAVNEGLADYEAIGRLRARQLMTYIRSKRIDLNEAFSKYDPHKIGEIDIRDFVTMLRDDFQLGWPEEDYECLAELFDGERPDQVGDGRVELTHILSYDKGPMDNAMLCSTVIIYLLYPTIARAMFTALACRAGLEDGGADMYLEYDTESPCFDATHIWFLVMIVLPSLGLYIFAFPILGMLNLKRNIAKLGWQNDTITYRYSILMSGYRREFWFWELVVSSRKVLLVGIAVFMGNYGTETQFFCAVLVIVFSLALQVHYRPMANDLLNRVENYSLMVLFLTLYLGLLFFWDTVVGPSRDLLAIGIIGMNSLFTAWCMGTIMLQWAARNAGSRVSKCLDKIDSNSAIVAILIIVPSLLYLIAISVMGACGCTCCDEKEEKKKRSLRQVPSGQGAQGRTANFEFDNSSGAGLSRRFRPKRLTLSNESGRQIFIDANMATSENKRLEIEQKRRESLQKLKERRVKRTTSRTKMNALGEESIPKPPTKREVEMQSLSPKKASAKEKTSKVTPASPAYSEQQTKELMQDLAADFMFNESDEGDDEAVPGGAKEEAQKQTYTL